MGRFDLTGIITDRYVTHDILRCCIEDRYLVATLHADVDFFPIRIIRIFHEAILVRSTVRDPIVQGLVFGGTQRCSLIGHGRLQDRPTRTIGIDEIKTIAV